MEDLKIKNIEEYKPIYILIIDLLYKYSLLEYCKISSDEEYETFEFIDKNNRNIYFCVDIALNIERRITFLYAVDSTFDDSTPHREFSDDYISSIIETDIVCKNILSFISNKVIAKEYFLKSSKVGNNLDCYYYDENEIKHMDDKPSPFFVLPWNRKKVKIKIYEFKPWIISEYSVKANI